MRLSPKKSHILIIQAFEPIEHLNLPICGTGMGEYFATLKRWAVL